MILMTILQSGHLNNISSLDILEIEAVLLGSLILRNTMFIIKYMNRTQQCLVHASLAVLHQ